MNNRDVIRESLFEMQDSSYKEFHKKLIPSVNPDTIIGVRTPVLRKLAKEIAKENRNVYFLKELPHRYYEENQLHAFIIALIKDYYQCIYEIERFLPYVDNWATCDQMSPSIFKKNKEKLLIKIRTWISSSHVYTKRFAIGMLMKHYLDEDFKKDYLKMVSEIKSGDYYVDMMRAWYFATALAKQYESTLPYLENYQLDRWTHNKTIQKAIESHRIIQDQKAFLRTIKI